MSLESMLLCAVFLAVTLGFLGIMEGMTYRKQLQKFNKQLKPLYREDASRNITILNRLAHRFNNSDYGKDLEINLKQANIRLTPFRWILIFGASWCIGSYLISHFLGLEFPYNLMITYLVLKLGINRWFKSRQNKLAIQINKQLPEVCRLIASSLRAGLSIQQGVELVAKELKKPVNEFYKTLSGELRMGTPLQQGLERLNERINSKDVHLMNNTLIIQQKVGGNLGTALEQMAKTLEERDRIKHEIRSITSESRYVAIILCAMPVIMLVLFNMIFDGFLKPMFTLPGIILMGVVAVLILIGLLVIRGITNIKV